MDNTIHVNATGRMISAIRRSLPQISGTAFADTLDAQSSAAYKEQIRARVDAMRVHSSRLSDNFEISISDAGYEAMRQDPEYEAFVLDTIQKELSSYNPMAAMTGGSTVFLRFGSEPSQYRADMFANGKNIMDKALNGEEKSFWEERQERREANEEISDRIARIRSDAKKIAARDGVAAADFAAASEILTLLLTELMTG